MILGAPGCYSLRIKLLADGQRGNQPSPANSRALRDVVRMRVSNNQPAYVKRWFRPNESIVLVGRPVEGIVFLADQVIEI